MELQNHRHLILDVYVHNPLVKSDTIEGSTEKLLQRFQTSEYWVS